MEALKDTNRLRGFVNGIYNFKAKKELKKLLDTLYKNETVIHVHGWTKALSSSVFDIAFKMNFKVVLTMHDYFTACPNGGYFNYKENKICKRKPLSWQCIKCNCDSRNYIFKLYRLVRQFVQNKIVKLPKKIKYAIGISDLSIDILKSTLNKNIQLKKIYNPIDFDENVEKVDYTKNEYYLYVGRISKEKGVDVFCQAVTELGLKGIAVGDGTEKERLETEYPNIEFTGWKNSNGVKKYMKGAKALIFPSLCYETAGLTILEALSLNKIVLVNNTCAGREFVSDEYLFKDYKDLIYKLKNIDNITKINYNLKKYSSENYENNILVYLKEINELG
jgi:glycosyltransferase involved in cell wall biosynthesis